MKIQLHVNYCHCGNYELDNLSDEALGALTRGMLTQARDDDNKESDVSWKAAKLNDTGDEIPF